MPSCATKATRAHSTSWAVCFGSPWHGHIGQLQSSAGCSGNDRHHESIPHSVSLMDHERKCVRTATVLSTNRSVVLHEPHVGTCCYVYFGWNESDQWTSPLLQDPVQKIVSPNLRRELGGRDASHPSSSLELPQAIAGPWHLWYAHPWCSLHIEVCFAPLSGLYTTRHSSHASKIFGAHLGPRQTGSACTRTASRTAWWEVPYPVCLDGPKLGWLHGADPHASRCENKLPYQLESSWCLVFEVHLDSSTHHDQSRCTQWSHSHCQVDTTWCDRTSDFHEADWEAWATKKKVKTRCFLGTPTQWLAGIQSCISTQVGDLFSNGLFSNALPVWVEFLSNLFKYLPQSKQFPSVVPFFGLGSSLSSGKSSVAQLPWSSCVLVPVFHLEDALHMERSQIAAVWKTRK